MKNIRKPGLLFMKSCQKSFDKKRFFLRISNHQANNCSHVQSNGFTSIQAVALAELNDQDWWNGER
jgi:hypothetical protein